MLDISLPDLSENDIVITSNRRLSNYLLRQHENLQQQNNKLAWTTPKIMPLSTWLTLLWQEGQHPQILLSPQAEAFLWQSIITAACEDFPLLDYQHAAQNAERAALIMQQWQIQPEQLAQTSNPDVQAFYQWWQSFQNRCEAEQWISQSTLPAYYIKHPPKILPQRLFLAGFDSLPPNIEAFLYSIASRCPAQVLALSHSEAKTFQFGALDYEHEIKNLAQWAYQQWLENPQINIGCIVPELLTERAKVLRAFADAFGDDYSHIVNIAGGVILNQCPLVQTAMHCLHLPLYPQPTTPLLLSPFWAGGNREWLLRAKMDRQIHPTQFCPILAETLTALSNIDITVSRFPSEWAEVWVDVLQCCGWPGERALDSEEFQQVQSLQQQLRVYAGLDWLLDRQSYAQALESLATLLGNALFQAESSDQQRIQVLGVLEAAGMQFDKIWITSLSDENWPQSPAPNPFLPMELQRQLGTPRASSQHELAYAQGILQRIKQSCDVLIASYPQSEGDRELRRSPLINDFAILTLDDLNLTTPAAMPRAELLTLIDDTGPAVTETENVKGGTRILQLQAKCPFRAFAEIRLRAEDFEIDSIGYNAAERGSLVHTVLAKLWEQLGDSARLHALSETEQHQFISDTVASVIQHEHPTTDPFFAELNRIDEQRLITLMHEWLNLEKQRAEFTVKAVEYPVELSLAGLKMRMRVDRIDILGDGSELIIDYKTGSPSPSSWFGERPDEPQLPLYVLHNSAVTKGIAFAQLKPHLQRFHGVTATVNQLPAVKAVTEWDSLVKEWQDNLTQLAVNFCAGDARVHPKQFPASCNECRLASICRITEQQENDL